MARGGNRGGRSGRSGGSGGRSGGRGNRSRRRAARPATNRQYPRTARLNALLQEIAADFVDRIDDDRLPMVTVTGVEVDSDLNRAQVFLSALGTGTGSGIDPDEEAELLEVMEEHAKGLRSKIGAEARIRKTPEVVFRIDPAVRTGARIEEILATLEGTGAEETEAGSEEE